MSWSWRTLYRRKSKKRWPHEGTRLLALVAWASRRLSHDILTDDFGVQRIREREGRRKCGEEEMRMRNVDRLKIFQHEIGGKVSPFQRNPLVKFVRAGEVLLEQIAF